MFGETLIIVLGGAFALSLIFSLWIVQMLDQAGADMHKALESNGEKYIRYVDEFGISTFRKVS